MWRWILATCLLTSLLIAQNADPKPGSISGRVLNAATGEPLPDIEVNATGMNGMASAKTDAEGRYRLYNLRPMRQTLLVRRSREHAYAGRRTIQVEEGTDSESVDLRVYKLPTVSGRITDENDEPLAGFFVSLLSREYFQGEVRYLSRGTTLTDDQGRYTLVYSYAIGTGLLLWATKGQRVEPFANDPELQAERRPAFVPTYFPHVSRPQEASVIHLAPGAQREDMDIQMIRSPSFCIEAHASLDSAQDAGFYLASIQPMRVISMSDAGRLNSDNHLRFCGLAPGDYRLSVYAGDENFPTALETMPVSITDADVKGLVIATAPRIPLQGRTSWAGKPPEQPLTGTISIFLNSLNRAMGGVSGNATSTIPGEFGVKFRASLSGGEVDPLIEEYAVRISRLPPEVYVKDILYGSVSVRQRPLALGSQLGGTPLRVILDHDGGRVRAVAVDENGEPLAETTTLLIPKSAATHLLAAETLLAGLTDQSGSYSFAAVAPGEYFALAVEGDFTDLSLDTIAALFNARSHAEEVTVGPNAAVELRLTARRLER